MHIYILGVCGTFMGSLAILAREMGFEVSGCDDNVYPPMSTQLEAAGITLDKGFNPDFLKIKPDLVVIGNAMSRGNAMVEQVLNQGLPYISGPQFLHDYVIRNKWVLAVAGTHGKTTTASMLAWILEYAGMQPGFLIGGVMNNFPFSARIGGSDFFVVEADEYDTAFFDKRSKFLHYQPRTLVMNNLEYDHADIFDSIEDIKRQFHHVVRLVPQIGKIIVAANDSHLQAVLAMGCWSPTVSFGDGGDWQAKLHQPDGSCFAIKSTHAPAAGQVMQIQWTLTGLHNVNNALAAVAAAEHVGIHPSVAAEALCQFDGVKRRMEKYAEVRGISLYDDFAHHPTAIATTLAGIRAKVKGRVLAVLEPRSNTMKMGVHAATLAGSVIDADKAYWFMSELNGWKMEGDAGVIYTDLSLLIDDVVADAQTGDHIVMMSNGGFQGLHQKLKKALEQKYA